MQVHCCLPCTGRLFLNQFDKFLRKGLCLIANLNLTDIQWDPCQPSRKNLWTVYSLYCFACVVCLLSHCCKHMRSPVQNSVTHFTLIRSSCGFCHNKVDLHSQSSTTRWYIIRKTACLVLTSHCCIQVNDLVNQSRARLLAIMAHHSGDWLHALPVASCGTRLDDEVVHVTVGLRLGTRLDDM